MLSKITAVLLSTFLMLFLNGCTTKQYEYEAVKVPQVQIPVNLLNDCPLPAVPKMMTFGESVQLNFSLLSAIDICNGQLSAIRKINTL